MNWVQIIANYILIGAGVSALLDWVNSKNENPEMRFSNMERFWMIILWPVSVLIFIYHFIKSWFE